jgi:hypothetical protein
MPTPNPSLVDIRLWAIEVTLGRQAAYNAAVASTNACPIQWLTDDVVAQADTLVKYILGDK